MTNMLAKIGETPMVGDEVALTISFEGVRQSASAVAP